MIAWQKAPGGKRYTATVNGTFVEIVKLNTAAGGPRWRATAGRAFPKRILGQGDYLADVKAACEAFATAEAAKAAA